MEMKKKSRIMIAGREDEFYYLEGPKSRWREFVFTLKVVREFITAFRRLHFVGPCITVFGSARFSADHIYYKLSEEIGKSLTDIGFAVMTGGGPGIMEGSNKGAFERKEFQLVRKYYFRMSKNLIPFYMLQLNFNIFLLESFYCLSIPMGLLFCLEDSVLWMSFSKL